MPRFAGVLASIGGNRTFVGSTSHLICSPLGTSGNCLTRIRKHPRNCENGELTSEFITKLAAIPIVQEEGWAKLTCPTPSCSTSVARSPSIFAATCALAKAVTGSAWQTKIRISLMTERWRWVTHSVSNKENGVLQLCEVEGRKAFDRPDGPSEVISTSREIKFMYPVHKR